MGYEPTDDDWYDRPNVYVDETTQQPVIRASSIGNCVMQLGYDWAWEYGRVDGNPEPPGQWLEAAWEESAALEQQAFDLFLDTWDARDIPDTELSEGEHARHVRYEVPPGGAGAIVEGTTDFEVVGELFKGWGGATVEIKVVGEALFDELSRTCSQPWDQLTEGTLPFKYRWQVASYVRGLDKPCLLVWCEKAQGGLTGRCSWVIYYPSDQHTIPKPEDFTTRTIAIVTAHKRVVDGQRACDQKANGCRWEKLCHEVVTVDDPEFVDLLHRYDIARKAVKEVEAIKGELNGEIQNWVDEKGPRLQTPDGDKVTVSVADVPERVVKAHTRRAMVVTVKAEKDKQDKQDKQEDK